MGTQERLKFSTSINSATFTAIIQHKINKSLINRSHRAAYF